MKCAKKKKCFIKMQRLLNQIHFFPKEFRNRKVRQILFFRSTGKFMLPSCSLMAIISINDISGKSVTAIITSLSLLM